MASQGTPTQLATPPLDPAAAINSGGLQFGGSAAIYNQSPNQPVQSIGGQSYNAFGDPVSGVQGVNTTYGGSGSAYGNASPSSAAAFQGIYDTEIGNLQNQYNALPSFQNADVNSIQAQYNPQLSTLQTQHATGRANLDLAQKQLDTTHEQGLRNLGNNLRGALNGYQNQIGVMGAGNSSAAPLIGYALSQQGNRQMADMGQNYGLQQTGLNQQGNDLEANFKNQMDTLEGWKQSQLNAIASKYAQQQQNLQTAIENANGQKATYLAMYGQTALANQAIDQMKQLESQYSDQVGQLHAQFQSAYAPQADISQYTGAPTINAINPSALTPLSFQNNQVTPGDTSATASLTKRPDQAPNSNLGF